MYSSVTSATTSNDDEPTPGPSTNIRRGRSRSPTTTSEEITQCKRRNIEDGTNEVMYNQYVKNCSRPDVSDIWSNFRTGGESSAHSYPVELNVDDFAGRMEGVLRNGERLVREVIKFESDEDFGNINKRFHPAGKRFNIKAIAKHALPGFKHIHVVHSCPWFNRECKCFGTNINFVRRKSRILKQDELDFTFWRNQLQYLCTPGKILYSIQCDSSKWSALHGIKFISNDRLDGSSRKGEMENCDLSDQDCVDDPRRNGQGHNTSEHMHEQNKEAQRIGTGKLDEYAIEKFILNNLTTPINAFTRSAPWQKSKYRFINDEHKMVKNVILSIRSITAQYSIDDFTKLHTTGNSLFLAINGDLDSYYYNVDDSLTLLLNLLEYQMCEDRENINNNHIISEFIIDLNNIFEKRIPKINCVEIISEPSAGKNYFIDCITAFYVNIGSIANFNRCTNFPLQDCPDRRILIWNEPNVESSALDTCKMLFAGDPCPARIKYRDDVIIYKTPIIVTSNKNVFPQTKAFNDRMLRYHWRTCDWLKTCLKYPHPMAWPQLVEWATTIQSSF